MKMSIWNQDETARPGFKCCLRKPTGGALLIYRGRLLVASAEMDDSVAFLSLITTRDERNKEHSRGANSAGHFSITTVTSTSLQRSALNVRKIAKAPRPWTPNQSRGHRGKHLRGFGNVPGKEDRILLCHLFYYYYYYYDDSSRNNRD